MPLVPNLSIKLWLLHVQIFLACFLFFSNIVIISTLSLLLITLFYMHVLCTWKLTFISSVIRWLISSSMRRMFPLMNSWQIPSPNIHLLFVIFLLYADIADSCFTSISFKGGIELVVIVIVLLEMLFSLYPLPSQTSNSFDIPRIQYLNLKCSNTSRKIRDNHNLIYVIIIINLGYYYFNMRVCTT